MDLKEFTDGLLVCGISRLSRSPHLRIVLRPKLLRVKLFPFSEAGTVVQKWHVSKCRLSSAIGIQRLRSRDDHQMMWEQSAHTLMAVPAIVLLNSMGEPTEFVSGLRT